MTKALAPKSGAHLLQKVSNTRLYLGRELFACLTGRGHIFDTI